MFKTWARHRHLAGTHTYGIEWGGGNPSKNMVVIAVVVLEGEVVALGFESNPTNNCSH